MPLRVAFRLREWDPPLLGASRIEPCSNVCTHGSTEAYCVKLQAQIVLYRNESAEIFRLLRSLASAVKYSTRRAALSTVVALGDSSPEPVLEPTEMGDLRSDEMAAGVREVSYQFFNENLGSSGGTNRLAEGTETDMLLVLNPDTYPTPNMLFELIKVMEDPLIGIAEARQIPIEHPKDYHFATGDTSWASGCCMLICRKAFDVVGGFDSKHFPLYCDDVDFSWRVKLAGYRVVHVPKAAVFHNKRITLAGTPLPAETEVYHATLARLMLASRYARPDIREETICIIEFKRHPAQLKALADFRMRQENGEVPSPIAEASRVAQFVDGEYATHRF